MRPSIRITPGSTMGRIWVPVLPAVSRYSREVPPERFRLPGAKGPGIRIRFAPERPRTSGIW